MNFLVNGLGASAACRAGESGLLARGECRDEMPVGPFRAAARARSIGCEDLGHVVDRIRRQAHQASAALHNALATLVMETTLADRMFVNDANSESSPGYGIVNARIISGAALGVSSAKLTIGVQNLFDKRWVSSVSVNAAGGKFYEPGSQRSLYLGLSLLGAPKSSR